MKTTIHEEFSADRPVPFDGPRRKSVSEGIAPVKRSTRPRRRPSIHITKARASRLYRLVSILAKGPHGREALLAAFDVGLRTLYREFELLKRCGVKVRLVDRCYTLAATLEESEGLLPFPDPLLSFAELAELAEGPGPAARRLAQLLKSVTDPPAPKPPRKTARQGARK